MGTPHVELGGFKMDSVPLRYGRIGHPAAAIDEPPGSLQGLLEQAARDQAGGPGDAPRPPHSWSEVRSQ